MGTMDVEQKYPPLNLPPASLNIKESGRGLVVMCQCRRQFVALTPEEWVRQHFIFYLVSVLGYPQGLVSAERLVLVNGLRQRADVVVFGRSLEPLMVVECKAPSISIGQKTMAQAMRYVSKLGARAVVLTNGLAHFCVVGGSYVGSIPRYDELVVRAAEG